MKIALIIHRYPPFIGGAEVFAQEVAEYLTKRGWAVDIITLCPNKSLNKLEVINGVIVHRIVTGRIRYLSFIIAHFRLLLYTLKLDNVRNYDLIHVVGDGLLSVLAAIIRKLKKKPIIITIQGGSLGAGFKNGFLSKILKWLQRWSFKNTDLIHVISRKLRQQVKEIGAHNIIIIPNGVDTSIFKPINKIILRKKHGFSQDEKVIISIARLIPRKGIDYLIKATALVSEYMPDVRLIIIGDGVQRAELEKLIQQLKLDDKVQILGFIPHNKIPIYLNMADIFVIPSLYEPLGIVTIEAMACGVPVIGSSVDGILDVIEDGKNGILVPPGDIKQLSDAIIRLLREENLRNEFAQEGLKTVRQKFLWETVLMRIEELYRNCIIKKTE